MGLHHSERNLKILQGKLQLNGFICAAIPQVLNDTVTNMTDYIFQI